MFSYYWDSGKHFPDIKKAAKTLLATKLADKIFDFFKESPNVSFNSSAPVSPIEKQGQSVIGNLMASHYFSAKKSQKCKKFENHENQIVMIVLNNGICLNFTQNQKLIDIQKRGGLMEVAGEDQEKHFLRRSISQEYWNW